MYTSQKKKCNNSTSTQDMRECNNNNSMFSKESFKKESQEKSILLRPSTLFLTLEAERGQVTPREEDGGRHCSSWARSAHGRSRPGDRVGRSPS
jgi:hypothetical protein